jgi:hypothetical protein
MKIIINILAIYGLAFVIGMFVAFVIWLLFRVMSSDYLRRFTHRDAYLEAKRVNQSKDLAV